MNLATTSRRLPTSAYNVCRQCLTTFTPGISRSLATAARPDANTPSPLGALGAEADLVLARKANAEKDDDLDESRYTSPKDQKSHHFHIYATKHNTHITLTNPDRNSIISISAGNIGFRKANRGTYDAAYQLAAYVLGRVAEDGLLQKIKKLEVVLRGFGVGREAVTKALLGSEGRALRPKITQVSDATRIKFGGTRSKKPRRLG